MAGKQYAVECLPFDKDDQIRPWNSADKLLVNFAIETNADQVLLVNDEYGVISLALHERECTLWTDSYLGWQACRKNFSSNNISKLPALCWSTETPRGTFSLAVLRLPKQLSMLEHQLIELSSLLTPGGTLITAGMDKHTPYKVSEMLGDIIGETKRDLGQKKAHLYRSLNNSAITQKSPYPSSYFCEFIDQDLINHANLFSRDKIDKGSRFMIENFSALPECETLFDLACGNGILGIVGALHVRPKTLKLFDESRMAVSCASQNSNAALNSQNIHIDAIHTDGLKNYHGVSPDLILCNPPFHRNFAIDDTVGKRLINDASRVLKFGGKLWLVANRHLSYYHQLRVLFKSVKEVSSNKKFIILEASK